MTSVGHKVGVEERVPDFLHIPPEVHELSWMRLNVDTDNRATTVHIVKS